MLKVSTLDVGKLGRWTLDVGTSRRRDVGTLDVGRRTLDVRPLDAGRWTLDVGRWPSVIADMPSVQHNLFYPYAGYHIGLHRTILPLFNILQRINTTWRKPCLTTESSQSWLTSRLLKNSHDPQTQARPDDPPDGGSTARRAQQRNKKTATPLTGQHVALGTAIEPEALNYPEDTRYKPHLGHDRRAARTESSQGWLKDPRTQARPKSAAPEDACRPHPVRRHP